MQGTFRRARLGRLLVVAVTLAAAALIGASRASADLTVTTNTPFTFSDVNPCTMEPFAGTGNFHFVESANLSAGGTAMWHSVADLNGLQATTLTGKKYVVKDDEIQTIVFDTPDTAPYHETIQWDVHFIRQGEDGSFILGDDFYSHILAHATVNANGVVTVDDYSESTSCN
jgi:hypothetical protein